jgi:predicted helicase
MSILNKFYDYQLDAFNTCQQSDKGIVCMPTGTGKTFVQAGIIADDIIKNPGFRMYIVNAPRIMLSFQLLEEVFKFNVSNGVDARYMAVHSGGMDQRDLDRFRAQTDIEYSLIESTTSPQGIADMIQKARNQNQPLIFFSTYNSMIRIDQGKALLDDPYVNIVLNDEAHYLIQERFNTDFLEIETHRKYFFTATKRETPSDQGLGMNNVEFYGETIYEMSPRKAIELGKMVRPRIHIVEGPNKQVYTPEDIDNNLGRIITDSFYEHGQLIKQAPKMLIAGRGVEDMKLLIRSREIQQLIEEGVNFYAVASDQEVSNYINGERVGRKEFLKRLQKDGQNPNQKLIAIHYDILTEGIDVPGLTGVLFLRDQRKAKFTQTFGRVARLDVKDRENFNVGAITPQDIDQMNKPYAWIIIPALVGEDQDKLSNLKGLIEELRDFEYEPSELVEPQDRPKSGGESPEDEIVPENNRARRAISEVMEEFEHKIEQEKRANDFLELISSPLSPDEILPCI